MSSDAKGSGFFCGRSRSSMEVCCCRKRIPTLSCAILLAIVAAATCANGESLPQLSPAEAGMSAEKLAEIDGLVEKALAEKKMPGCVVLVGRRAGVVYRKAYGLRQVQPGEEAMTVDTVFDLASLTKPIATATAIMQLVDEGKLKVSDRVSEHWPEFGQNGKENVTVEHLLLHTSGLIADNALRDYLDGTEKAWERIAALKLQQPSGEKFVYSDVNFLVLGKLVERLSGKTHDEFCRKRIFEPLGMKESGYVRLANRRGRDSLSADAQDNGNPGLAEKESRPPMPRERYAPTEKRNGEWIRGEVHDPRAYYLDGVAGHAGVFSTADDLARYATAMLQKGELGEARLFSEETWKLMTTPREVLRGLRTYGWDSKSGFSSNRGQNFSSAAFGHGGFTGTAIWIDPELDLYVIFLSNRVHPDGKGSVNPLAGAIGTVAGESIAGRDK